MGESLPTFCSAESRAARQGLGGELGDRFLGCKFYSDLFHKNFIKALNFKLKNGKFIAQKDYRPITHSELLLIEIKKNL